MSKYLWKVGDLVELSTAEAGYEEPVKKVRDAEPEVTELDDEQSN